MDLRRLCRSVVFATIGMFAGAALNIGAAERNEFSQKQVSQQNKNPAPPSGPNAPNPPSGPNAPNPPSGPNAPNAPSGPNAPNPPSGPNAPNPPSGGPRGGGI